MSNEVTHLSRWRLPQISLRSLAIWRRNWMAWLKLALYSVVGNVAEPLISLAAFGYGLGAMLQQVQGVPYVLFLASGAICSSVMNAATFETLYSAFSRMQVQRSWDALLNAPLDLDDIVVAEWCWAASKSLMTACAIMLVIVVLNISREPMMLLALPFLFLTGLTFAGLGLIINALAPGYDFFSYYITLVITPMMFLSGIFFPLEQLPHWLQLIAASLPLKSAVDLVRPLILGHLPNQIMQPVLILCAYGFTGLYVATVLTRRRLLK